MGVEILVLQKFLVAIGIGALIGAEREREKLKHAKDVKVPQGSGFRSFILISLLGGITSYLTGVLGLQLYAPFIFGGFSLLIVLSYYFFAAKGNLGIITEVSSFLIFLLGFLALTQYTMLAVVLSAIIVILIESEKFSHEFIKNTSHEEWYDTLKFAAISLIIYPILPTYAIDPWGLINPSEIWLLVVLISGFEFVGYFLIKIIGSNAGVLLNGFLGGLVSSTAVTLSMSQQSKKYEKLASSLALATTVASVTMFVRMTILVGVVANEILPQFILFVSIPTVVMILSGIFVNRNAIWNKENHADPNMHEDLGTPFRFGPALKMALMFGAVKIIVKIASEFLGSSGLLVTSAISGLVDVDAITVSVGGLFSEGTVLAGIAIQAILLAAIMNTLVKAIIAKMNGSKEFGNKVITIFGSTFVAGLLVIVYQILQI